MYEEMVCALERLNGSLSAHKQSSTAVHSLQYTCSLHGLMLTSRAAPSDMLEAAHPRNGFSCLVLISLTLRREECDNNPPPM